MSITRRAMLTGAVAFFASAAARAQRGDTVLTATDVHVQGYPTVEALRWVGDTLERETGGRLRLRLYHSGQLGRESDSIDMARFGALDITRVNMAALNNPFPSTQILSLPYVFDSTAHMRRALDGAVGREILASFERRDLVGLAFYDSGARCFYNTRRPVYTPQDLHGLKIRVPPSDIFMDMVRALGANPTPLPYGEVFSALQTHLIDGAENNWQSFHTTRQFEVAHYWSQTAHSYSPEALLMSKQRLESLATEDRALVLDIAARSVTVMRELWDKSEIESRDYVIAKGVKVNEVDRRAFETATAATLSAYRRDPAIDTLYKKIRALA
ncbi:TRAP transporter substrate-binding protein [Pseudolysobacter antarcticus]|uniref:TRAP transporter substrate-binding protein n=1 Tax=Pseudolysobacter antarcticus TaxID=2511995 RepID=A0A411HG40_9GAMM|nr:TRAP transporter substrate-binding protein [Pseudolysobacter antarcticus]QBB69410.1 TRAP transporter substrate-binding protein [Pseudolysobacter antarcticus]